MKAYRLVYDLRNERGVSQKTLIRGLISLPDFSRFENGEKDLSYPMVEALVQRLGKSCDKFELRLNQEEYEALFMRHLIMHSLLDTDRFERLCEAFEEIDTAEQVLHEQYLVMMNGCAAYLQKHDAEKAYHILSKALQRTFPTWQEENWKKYLLCAQELQILLLMCYCAIETKDTAGALWILEHVRQKITQDMTDEEEYARIWPQWCYLRATAAVLTNNTDEVRRYSAAGRACLIQNGLLTLMNEFLELEIQFGSDPETAVRQRDALHYAYEISGQSQKEHVFYQMVKRNQHRALILVHELIRDTRQHLGIRQEELSWGICATETLSRIESGKRKAQRRNRERLYERLKLDTVPYQVMETDDFHLLEWHRDLSRLLFKGELPEAENLFYGIYERLNMSLPENEQYIVQTKTQLDVEEGRISCADAIPVLEAALRLTCRDYDGYIYRTPTRNEFYLLVQMAVYYNRMKETDRSVEILTDVLRQYEDSAVAEDDHSREHLTLYINLTGFMAERNNLQSAKEYALRGMDLAIRCMRGDVLGHLLWNLALANRKRGYAKKAVSLAEISYHILQLYKHDKAAEKVKKIFSLDG